MIRSTNEFRIKGIPISFPFRDLYACQRKYMEKVIDCLNDAFSTEGPLSRNALLESPTGTGKTLSLLCSALGWIRNYYSNAGEKLLNPPPRIIFCTRTHTQVKQVLKELKNSPYKPVTCVLASRINLCPHVRNQKMTSKEVNLMCLSKRKNGCEYYSRLQASDPGGFSGGIRDIEELVSQGRQEKFCPYYFQRDTQIKRAHLTVMPYNYLISPNIRKTVDLDLRNTILLVDEAHNIEKLCEDSVSFEFDTLDIPGFINGLLRGGDYDKLCEDLLELESEMAETFKEVDGESKEAVTFDGKLLSEFFYGLKANDTKLHIGSFKSAGVQDELGMWKRSCGYSSSARNFVDFITAVLQLELEDEEYDKNFRVVVTRKVGNGGYVGARFPEYEKFRKDFADVEREVQGFYKIHFMCLSSSVAMGMLKKEHPKSIILTSGTLSPLETFTRGMGMKFRYQLRNRHVVDATSQLFAWNLRVGPGGEKLNSTYQNRKRKKYQLEVGRVVLEVCRITPDGVLVFFPSTALMRKCIECWKSERNGEVFKEIANLKRVVVEDAKNSKAIMGNYRRVINEGRCGAVLFAVCRGKVSEGMDFSGRMCRAVLVVGMPYPPKNDYRIEEKMKYLDELQEDKEKDSFSKATWGRLWYSQQSARAVNQSVGRVIRHKTDFGAMLFVDERFSKPNMKNMISSWIQPRLKNFKNFSSGCRLLSAFFSKHKASEMSNNLINIEEAVTRSQIHRGKVLFPKFEKLREGILEEITTQDVESEDVMDLDGPNVVNSKPNNQNHPNRSLQQPTSMFTGFSNNNVGNNQYDEYASSAFTQQSLSQQPPSQQQQQQAQQQQQQQQQRQQFHQQRQQQQPMEMEMYPPRQQMSNFYNQQQVGYPMSGGRSGGDGQLGPPGGYGNMYQQPNQLPMMEQQQVPQGKMHYQEDGNQQQFVGNANFSTFSDSQMWIQKNHYAMQEPNQPQQQEYYQQQDDYAGYGQVPMNQGGYPVMTPGPQMNNYGSPMNNNVNNNVYWNQFDNNNQLMNSQNSAGNTSPDQIQMGNFQNLQMFGHQQQQQMRNSQTVNGHGVKNVPDLITQTPMQVESKPVPIHLTEGKAKGELIEAEEEEEEEADSPMAASAPKPTPIHPTNVQKPQPKKTPSVEKESSRKNSIQSKFNDFRELVMKRFGREEERKSMQKLLKEIIKSARRANQGKGGHTNNFGRLAVEFIRKIAAPSNYAKTSIEFAMKFSPFISNLACRQKFEDLCNSSAESQKSPSLEMSKLETPAFGAQKRKFPYGQQGLPPPKKINNEEAPRCCICSFVPKNLHILKGCRHGGCFNCWKTWFESERRNYCPCCRDKTGMNNLEKIFV